MMPLLTIILGIFVILFVLLDLFETVVLPRRVTRPWRLTTFVFRGIGGPWRMLAARQPSQNRRESVYSFFGPLSVILLLAVWTVGLLIGYALLMYGVGSPMHLATGNVTLWTHLYFSATNFFTLGLGDITPTSPVGRLLVVLQAATGFTVLALVISYLPVLYQAFSRREATVSLLDARAGSPPSAVELLTRHSDYNLRADFDQFLRDWEVWTAELMESHPSYPVLAYFRSQHDNQSWVAALTTILDACTLIIAGMDDYSPGRARLTFAITRHAAVDLCQVFNTPPKPPHCDRLSPAALAEIRAVLAGHGLTLREGPEVDMKLAKLRAMYEPYVNALADWLLLPLPSWMPAPDMTDNWRSTAWEPRPGAPLF